MPLRDDFTDESAMATDHAAHHNAVAAAVNAASTEIAAAINGLTRWHLYDDDPQNPSVGDLAFSASDGGVYKWAEPAPFPIVTSVSPSSGVDGATITITGSNFWRNGTPFPDEQNFSVYLFESGTLVESMDDWLYAMSLSGWAIVSDTEITVTVDVIPGYDWMPGIYGPHGLLVSNPEGNIGILHDAFTLLEE